MRTLFIIHKLIISLLPDDFSLAEREASSDGRKG
nr:MAG TPA: hypothetical protein [Caudoviricetes sp.]